MRQVKLVVEYDGTTLCGWQRQASGATVQGELEIALAKLLQHETPCAGASRTDAGVHALGQVCAFRTERTIPLHGIRRGLNTMLPHSIAVVDAQEVADDFHPRFGAIGKHYRYALLARADRSPLLHDRAWHLRDPIDVEPMRVAAAALAGEHDFAAFRAAGCSAKTTLRRIERIDVTRVGDQVLIDVRGNAFLRNMVRILAGTLAEVGTGDRPATQMAEIIESRDRIRAGITAPAGGLTLVSVFYPGV
jgi:tRNA pseudouridine38-40 synthase